jgi:aspartyl-tRNA(Asn)/glutamyl-tRNA(Gln) amidotransferase subunit C
MKLTVEQVRHVATLARCRSRPRRRALRHAQLRRPGGGAQLQELDVSGVEPTSHATLAASLLREDATRPRCHRRRRWPMRLPG